MGEIEEIIKFKAPRSKRDAPYIRVVNISDLVKKVEALQADNLALHRRVDALMSVVECLRIERETE